MNEPKHARCREDKHPWGTNGICGLCGRYDRDHDVEAPATRTLPTTQEEPRRWDQ